jgi:predicted metal-dependent hydrolase
MQRLTFETPTGSLEYTIKHRSRVKKRLHMEIDEHGGLVVVAPRHWTKAHIRATLSQNSSRVERFLARVRKQQFAPLLYVEGEAHFYLGNRYPLKTGSVPGRKNKVGFTGQEIRVEPRQAEAGNIQSLLQAWYRQQAMDVFGERLQLISSRASWAKNRSIPLKLRKMKRTWGNCSSRGVIKLNTHLIKAPLPVIDSVIAHELCHLEEMNHSRAFYTLLEGLNPDWRQDRAWLRSEGHIYLL